MSSKRKKRLFILNTAIVLVNIVLFAQPFLGLSLTDGDTLSVGVAWGALLVSALVFVRGNSRILAQKDTRLLAQSIQSLEGCVPVFQEAIRSGDVFANDIRQNIDQAGRFRRKHNTIREILLQKFSAGEMSFQKFNGVLQEVEQVVYMNMRSILNKISAFDMADYQAMRRQGTPNSPQAQAKMDIYNDYISFVKSATHANEDILLKMDKMLLEISRYNSLEGGDVQNLPAVVEMDQMIKNASLYR